MDISGQMILIISALGGVNTALLAGYLTFHTSKTKDPNYFLPLLLLAVSIRVIKSVFFYYNRDLAGVFIQIGLSGCVLIGPLLYLYLKKECRLFTSRDWWHPAVFLIGITILGLVYPYTENRQVWSTLIVRGIYLQWLIYLIFSFPMVKAHLYSIIGKNSAASQKSVWLSSIFVGVTFIWLGYNLVKYTSYIVGALSSTFIFYLIALLLIFWYHNRGRDEEKVPYLNKSIDPSLIDKMKSNLPNVRKNQLFLDPNLTLAQVASSIKIPPHLLSQYLNDHIGKSFTHYINEMRIEYAQQLLLENELHTIESLGYESGFNSKSTFYSSFKKIAGMTPNQFRKKQIQGV